MTEEESRNDAVCRAEEAVRAAAAKAAADPARPMYHFHAPAQWMNDPNGPIFHRGWYHLFYQTNPFGELCWGDPTATVEWGHARSRDLVHWEHLPLAMWPSKELGEDHCWSGGCVIRDDGRPMIFYTSIGPTHQPGDSAQQWAAIGDDELVTWRKHPKNPIVPDPRESGVRILDWRDPFVFREGSRWYMVTGGHREGGKGCISLFRSDDLERWEFVGVPIEGEEDNWECPSLFRLGDRWVLIYSPHRPSKYYVGQMDFEHCKFTPERWGQFDFGRFIGYYALTMMPDPKGRMILWGWLFSDKKGRGWNGCLALPRVLSLLPDGSLGQAPLPEIETLRRDEQSASGLGLGGVGRSYGVKGGCLEAIVRFRTADAAKYGVRLLDSSGAVAASIDCGAEGITVAGDRVPPEAIGERMPLELRLFVDRSMLELYVNGRVTVTRWIDSHQVERLELYAEQGAAVVERVDLWRMAGA